MKRMIDNKEYTTLMSVCQSFVQNGFISDTKIFFNDVIVALSKDFPVKVPKDVFKYIIYSFMIIMVNNSALENELEDLIKDIEEILKERDVQYNDEQLSSIKTQLKDNMQKAILKVSKTVRTPDKKESTIKSKKVKKSEEVKNIEEVVKNDKKTIIAKLSSGNDSNDEELTKEDCIHLYSVYYLNPKDGYIYIIGRTIEKRWIAPIPKAIYVEKDSGMVHYKVEIRGIEYVFSREELGNSKYRQKIKNISLLENNSFAGTYANCITKLAEDCPIFDMLERTGIHEYEVDKVIKHGFMLPTGDMLTAQNTYYSYVSLKNEISEDRKKKYYEYVERAKTISNNDIRQLYTFLIDVADNGIALILQSHNARSFFTSLKSSTYKPSHSLLMYGTHGSGKTELCMFSRGLAYPYEYEGEKDASFRSTLTSIEIKIDSIQDLPCIIDDLYKPKSNNDSSMVGKEKLIDTFSRSLHDGIPIRERANSHMQLQKTNRARSLIMFTSEYYPENLSDSTYRRLLAFKVDKDLINRDLMKEQASKLSYVQFAVGSKIILQVLNDIEKYGKLEAIKLYEKQYKKFESIISEKIVEKWYKEQKYEIPHFKDSLVQMCADILLGSWMLDKVLYITSFVEKTLPYLIDILYIHMLKVEKMTSNEEGYTLVEYALNKLLEGIQEGRVYKIENSSERLFIADYDNILEPPKNIIVNNKHVSNKQWGYDRENADKQKVAMYIQSDKNKVYITPIGIDAMLDILKDSEDFKHVMSEKALSQLMDNEQWIIDKGDKTHLAKKIKKTITEGNKRVIFQTRGYVIAFDRLWALMEKNVTEDIDEQEEIEQETDDNVVDDKVITEEKVEQKRVGKSADKLQKVLTEI